MHELGVTPRVGVWIETVQDLDRVEFIIVTPRVGVWIETPCHIFRKARQRVTPRVGVWIETSISGTQPSEIGHSPRGSVDWN